VNLTDPTGHKACDGDNSTNACRSVKKDDLTNLVSFKYGWKLAGAWTMHKIDKLLNFASNFAADIFKVTGKDGATWIRNHVGNAVIKRGAVSSAILKVAGAGGMVPTNTDVLLPTDYGEYTLIHEMAHVFDNNVKNGILPATYNGGGPSDAMVSAMHGNPEGCFPRFQCGFKPFPTNNAWYRANVAGSSSPWDVSAYANNGVADDFADTFASTLTGNSVPPTRQLWMTSFLKLLP